MSKEQTPIEELVEQIKLIHGAVPLEEEYLNRMIQKEKEFTQSKVLEALEREVPEAFRQGRIEESNIYSIPNYKKIRSTKYYETEVKPKYEK